MAKIPYSTPEDKGNFQEILDNMSKEQLENYSHQLIQSGSGHQFDVNFEASRQINDTWFDKVMGRK